MGIDFEERVRECVPSEAIYVNIDTPREFRGMIELGDGSLLGVSGTSGSTSFDGGKTWSEAMPLMQTGESVMDGDKERCLRWMRRSQC